MRSRLSFFNRNVVSGRVLFSVLCEVAKLPVTLNIITWGPSLKNLDQYGEVTGQKPMSSIEAKRADLDYRGDRRFEVDIYGPCGCRI